MSSSRRGQVTGTGLKVAVIGDDDTVAGFLLSGIGAKDRNGSVNFLNVSAKTPTPMIEDAFTRFTTGGDVGVILINQTIADRIRHLVDNYHATLPTVLEIPSKDAPYDASKDSVMQRVQMFFGGCLPSPNT